MPRMVAEDDGYFMEGGGLSIAAKREKMAQEGDFQGLWRVLTDNKWSMIDQAECFRLLLQAIEVAARTDPRQFSAAIFNKILSFSSYLLLRTHFQLRSLVPSALGLFHFEDPPASAPRPTAGKFRKCGSEKSQPWKNSPGGWLTPLRGPGASSSRRTPARPASGRRRSSWTCITPRAAWPSRSRQQ